MQLKSTIISPYQSPENRMQDIYGQTIENSININQYMLKRLDKIIIPASMFFSLGYSTRKDINRPRLSLRSKRLKLHSG